MTVDLERVRSVLHAAVEALTDLGACDDEDCQELSCNHALPRAKELLAELRRQAPCNVHRLPALIQLQAKQHHVLLCPECGSELRLNEIRILGSDVTWDMECMRYHRWFLTWDLWGGKPETRVFVWGPVDVKATR